MTELAIKAEKVGKSYTITHSSGARGYKTLQEDLIRWVRQPWRKGKNQVQRRETFWALKDVSFEVKQGEVFGIIGRNGAGKSTLLKILSRITRPTSGYADVYGRIGSLLEVGTGFHPELTGRENIFLNGAVLGMNRREIQDRFDEIVAFAEIEQFLDTPVKRYSSGMYMRLAFAVAAHLDPEILVVDEVLAVGDAKFQEKCLGKMDGVAKSGRTVLFVSHNMAAVQQLCKFGIVLNAGKLMYTGPVSEAISTYMQLAMDKAQTTNLLERRDRQGSGSLRFTQVGMYDHDGKPVRMVLSGQTLRLRFYYKSEFTTETAQVNIAFNVFNSQGILLTHLNSRDVASLTMSVGRSGFFECIWPHFNLRSGVYNCNLYCEVNGTVMDWIQGAFPLTVEDGDFHGTGLLVDRSQGDVLVTHSWRSQPLHD